MRRSAAKADELLSAKAAGGDERRPGRNNVTSIQMAVAKDPAHNFALISVPGDYAAAEAMKALRLGMDVMLFSDNVPPESELALKHTRANTISWSWGRIAARPSSTASPSASPT